MIRNLFWHPGSPPRTAITTRLRLRSELGLPRRIPVYARRAADHVPLAASGPCASTPVLPPRKKSNRRYRYLLEQGQTGLSVAFDLPTQIGYDADDPIAEGEVGKVGVSISSIEDMAQLFDQIPLDKVSTSMTINAPAAVLLAMYIAVAKRQGADVAKLRGTIQNDILKEYTARGTYIFPPAAFDALDHGYFLVLRPGSPQLEHDLDLGLPHP